MSEEAVLSIIRTALVNEEFRNKLFSDPAAALSGYDLSEEEKKSLSSMQEEAFEALTSELEERISKAGIGFKAPGRDNIRIGKRIRANDLKRLFGG